MKIYISLSLSLLSFTTIAEANLSSMFLTHNAVVFNEANFGKEIENKVIVGGILNIRESMQFGVNISIPRNEPILSVGGGINGNGNWININQGSILSRNTPGPLNINYNSLGGMNTGQLAWNNNMINLGFNSIFEMKNSFNSYSDFLANQPVTGSYNFLDPNQYLIKGNGDMFSFITVNGNEMQNARGIGINLNGSETLIVNVIGDGNYNFNNNWLGGDRKDVIWNYTNANTVNFNGPRVVGSLIAPNATVYTKGGWEGLWVVDNLTSDDEGHFNPMNTPIPELESSIILISIAGLSVFRRKR